jgi:DNA-binding GntR family transcriptional regulator
LEERDFLTLSGTDKVYRLEILRFIGLTPLGLTTSVLPESVVPGLEQHLESFRSLHGLLEKHYHFIPFKKLSIFEARMPLVREAELLELSENIPIFWKVNLLINAEGVPVELDFFRNRGDLIQYVVDYDKVDIESQQKHPIE